MFWFFSLVHSLKDAVKKSKKELKKVFSLAVDKLGEKRAAIFEAQMMILEDQVLLDKLYSRIDEEKISPEFGSIWPNDFSEKN